MIGLDEVKFFRDASREDLLNYIDALKYQRNSARSQRDSMKNTLERLEYNKEYYKTSYELMTDEKEKWKQRYIAMVLNDAAGTLEECDQDLEDIQRELEMLMDKKIARLADYSIDEDGLLTGQTDEGEPIGPEPVIKVSNGYAETDEHIYRLD